MQVVPLVARSDSISRLPDDTAPHPAELQIAASARLLEDLAQTCAVLRSACVEQADLLRTLSRDPLVLAQLHRAEAHLSAPGSLTAAAPRTPASGYPASLAAASHGIGPQEYSARKGDFYQQHPAPAAHVMDR